MPILLWCTLAARATDIQQPIRVDNWQVTTTVVSPSLYYFSNVSLSTTPVQVKASSTDIWGFYAYNNATPGNERSIKFYNRLTPPVVGTTPADLTFTIGGRSPGTLPLPSQIPFSNGLWINATTGSGTTATGAPLAGEVSIMIFYK